MNISICITVFNEEKSIGRLLESLLKQTKKPNEVVIVDGGSKDKTVKKIKEYESKFKKKGVKLKVKVKRGASIAEGRNASIRLAKGEVIALTDAGCAARKNWLELITRPFRDKKVGLVAGFYNMKAKGALQRALNIFHGVPPEKFDYETFLPSARSVAFRKDVWNSVGEFNEDLDRAGEDTQFFYKVVKEDVKIKRVKEARVVWEESKNITFNQSIDKFFAYAKGDAQAGIWWHPEQRLASHNIKIFSIFVRYVTGGLVSLLSFIYPPLFYVVLFGLFAYILFAFYKVYSLTSDIMAGLWGIIVQFGSDIAVMVGFVQGTLTKNES